MNWREELNHLSEDKVEAFIAAKLEELIEEVRQNHCARCFIQDCSCIDFNDSLRSRWLGKE